MMKLKSKLKSKAIPEIHEVDDSQVDFAAKRLMEEIIIFRKEVECTPIKCEPLYLTEAAELCTVGVTGNMVNNLLTLQELGDKKDQVDWMDKHWLKVIIGLIILMVPLIYYMIINRGG